MKKLRWKKDKKGFRWVSTNHIHTKYVIKPLKAKDGLITFDLYSGKSVLVEDLSLDQVIAEANEAEDSKKDFEKNCWPILFNHI